MDIFWINQKIKIIKDVDCFDSLINWDCVYTSYLSKGQRSVMYFNCTMSRNIPKMGKILRLYILEILGHPIEARSMYTISINQRIKTIKIIKSLIFLDFFDFLIIFELTHTSYLNKGQWKTDKDCLVLGHMAIIPFPVLCECRNVLKRE